MLKFKIDPTSGFTKRELVKLEKSRVVLELIFNSELFRKKMLLADFSGETSKWRFSSNHQILDHVMKGAETLQPEINHQADIQQGIFNPNYWSKNVVGRTWKSRIIQEINRKLFWTYPVYKVAGNIAHEWFHKLGFGHDSKRTKRRPFSVCYQVNKIIKECYFELLLSEIPEPEKRTKRRPFWHKVIFFWK